MGTIFHDCVYPWVTPCWLRCVSKDAAATSTYAIHARFMLLFMLPWICTARASEEEHILLHAMLSTLVLPTFVGGLLCSVIWRFVMASHIVQVWLTPWTTRVRLRGSRKPSSQPCSVSWRHA